MSAFMCSDAHIAVLVNAAEWYGIGIPPALAASPPELFATLVCENVASLRARYGKRAGDMGGDGPHRWVRAPRPAGAAPPLPALHVLKLAQSYSYQSCEHDGWNTSVAKKWIDLLTASLVYEIPGYDVAPWSI